MSVLVGIGAVELEAFGQGTAFHARVILVFASLREGGEDEHCAEDDGQHGVVEIDGHGGTRHGTEGGGDLEEHAQTDVGDALFDIGGTRTAGGGNRSHEGGTDGIVEVDPEAEREQGDDDHPTAQSGERAEQACAERTDQQDETEEKNGHGRKK